VMRHTICDHFRQVAMGIYDGNSLP
jgi:hypothetical protein